jgi:protein-L-isoaspartate(D-aspartate) O-methyltransferase
MTQVPRHIFVDDALKSQAHADTPLNIGLGQTISQPYIVALMTQALALSGTESVLEIGTGCGYQTVILALLARRVWTIERFKSLAMSARRSFKMLGLKNVVMRVGDGSVGWPEGAPFDGILLACAAPTVSPILVEQLAPNGRLVMPLEDAHGRQTLLRITRGPNGFMREDLGACRFVRLVGRQGFQG